MKWKKSSHASEIFNCTGQKPIKRKNLGPTIKLVAKKFRFSRSITFRFV